MTRRRRTALAAALSLLPIGQPLLLGTLTGTTTATTAVILQAAPVFAQDVSAVARIAKAITVRIEGATQGSGVLVKQEGNRYTVLTAWHVVSGNRPGEEVGIYTSDGNEHQLEQGSIQRLGEVDMAVLSFSSGSAYEVANVGDIKKVKHDQPIYVAGFPLNNSQNLRYETGEVVANAEVGIDQGYQLLYDNTTVAGMSGGVLLNSDGDLVGLHGRGERDEQASSGELVMKTGVNQGVPITYYNLFASGAPVVVAKNTATTADDYLAQAKASQSRKGREQTVIKLTTQALALRSSGGGYFLRAYAKKKLKDYQGAIADYSKALEINPEDANTFNNRGNAKHGLGDYQGAISDYTKAIELDPQHALAYDNRGYSKHDLKDYQAAIADYNKAIEIDPQYAIAYNNRGTAKDDLKDYQGAIADYNKAIELDPQHAFAFSNRGITKRNLGDTQGAIADYNKAIEINPQNAIAYNNRGLAKSNLGSYQEAIADCNKAIQIDPQYAGAYNSRGWIKYLQGDFQGALKDANKALAIAPNDGATLDTRGLAKHALGQDRSACKDLKRASSLGYQGTSQYLQSEEGAWCSNMR
ncbi:tetratricopeptide repeat-containing S1 family peptidase [Prochlorococcus marinus]|uniref:Uncharacterized protein n=1 Tax=Prochlorococcus marinus (strain MIT 9303) TaxID=59922 RepID=A2CDP0_PROM3|nr:tetratricopeptide repeat-containing serine protease family protein [Prochlorococcus marinus]ABM79600.1 Hypothetical protein P9303_28701 [Prochlorococcus marinus str. MIT 9303]